MMGGPLGGGGGGVELGNSGRLPLATSASSSHLYQRPSSLHGLKHKLHSSKVGGLHAANTPTTPNRRKSVAHIPLSPLARTPSPTRSPSPLAFPTGHHPGSSNTTQSYSPTVQGNSSGGALNLNVSGSGGGGGHVTGGNGGNGSGPQVMTGSAIMTPSMMGVAANNNPSNCIVTRRSFTNRPKSSEQHSNNNSSPLLRRALSPDRPHLRGPEGKCTSVSPLCNPPPVNSGGGGGSDMGAGGSGSNQSTSGIWRSPSVTTTMPSVVSGGTGGNGGGGGGSSGSISGVQGFMPIVAAESKVAEKKDEGLTLQLQQTGTGSDQLPRIAEEKDSPTSAGGGGAVVGGIVGEILKELKGVKVEPMAGDVKDKIRRFSFGAQLDQKLELARGGDVAAAGGADKDAGKCDKVAKVVKEKNEEEGEKKKNSDKSKVKDEAKAGGGGGEVNPNINHQPTGHSNNNSSSSDGKKKST